MSDELPEHLAPKPLDAFGIPLRPHVARGGLGPSLFDEPFSGSSAPIMAGAGEPNQAGARWTAAQPNGRRVDAMKISPAYVDVAVERRQAETGRATILEGNGLTFAQLKGARLGDHAISTAEAPNTDAPSETARKRKAAAQHA